LAGARERGIYRGENAFLGGKGLLPQIQFNRRDLPSPFHSSRVWYRVARWYICIPKIQMFLYVLEGLLIENFGIYLTALWYILW
jgi:hypothetical protein